MGGGGGGEEEELGADLSTSKTSKSRGLKNLPPKSFQHVLTR